jgi:hypothetical protein
MSSGPKKAILVGPVRPAETSSKVKDLSVDRGISSTSFCANAAVLQEISKLLIEIRAAKGVGAGNVC